MIECDIKKDICEKSREMLKNNFLFMPEIYEIELFKKKFIQYSDVFPVDIFKDASFFTPLIVINKNEKFLEMGSGSGITSVIKAIEGAEVTGLDINPNAIENSIKNAVLNNVEKKCNFFLSDVFEGIDNQLFDTIYWNVPFCSQEINTSILERSIIDFEYRSLEKFFKDCRGYLKPDGRILIGFSKIIGDYPKLKEISKKYGFTKFETLGTKMINWNNFTFDLSLYQIKN